MKLKLSSLPNLPSPKMPPAYKKKALTIHGMLAKKLAVKMSKGSFSKSSKGN